jgi:CII-binding regulator of phage lambda lysogenization HflD
MNNLTASQISSVKSAVDFAAAGFGTYTDIVEALGKTLQITGDEAAVLMADEVLARIAADN